MDPMMVNTQSPKEVRKPKTNHHCQILGAKSMDFEEKLKVMQEEIKDPKLDEDEVLQRTLLTTSYPWEMLQELLGSEVNLVTSPKEPPCWQSATSTTEDVLKTRSLESFLELENLDQVTPDVAEGVLQFSYLGEGFAEDNADDVSKPPAEVPKKPSTAEQATHVIPGNNTFEVEQVDVGDIFTLGEDTLNASFSEGTPRGEAEEDIGDVDIEVDPAVYEDKSSMREPLPSKPQDKEPIINEAVGPKVHHDIILPKASDPSATKTSRHKEPVRSEEIFEQISDKIKLTVRGKEHEINIRLKPDHLGDVLIKVSTEKGRFKAELYVENPEVRHTLQSFAQDLKGQFLEKGFDFSEISVYQMAESWQANSQNHGFTGQHHQGHPKKGKFIGMDGIADEALVQSSYDLWDEDSSVNYMI